MKSIKRNTDILYEISKSKFYAFLIRVDSLEEIESNLKKLKETYPDATHHCYAYIVDQHKKCSDDGEPSGTAGKPILNVLEQRMLDHVLCVVIRYFGGIKLGAGGLVRAYSKSASLATQNATIIELYEGYKIQIEFSYEEIKQVNVLLTNYSISYKEYDRNVLYEFEIKKDLYETLKKELEKHVLKIEIKKEMLI